ncbi:MAG TPA: tRNA uridine-5-carboxymethylaminomethyl(34) synthesis GTPase MnmE [Steroidobacteraceae bacterium]|nr:tRNA uridine-5-carboxymethylaminomethyl(34) synthesis GTPase MnmE [Steroidobacteraceae bacterium]
MSSPDTIAAAASAPGRGAVGVIRVSGPLVPRIATALLGRLPAPRQARLGSFLDAQGAALDEGLALYFPAPASYTGEHVLEIQGHGGTLVIDLVLKRLLELGCRLARPGEFTERAYLNGKVDIAQAEAIADLIDAGTAAAARAAVRSLQGEFSARIAELQSSITGLRVYVEAAIDFPDEEIDFLSGEALRLRLGAVFLGFESITAAARQGALLREGLNVVIAGLPNAGKSTLLNSLAGQDVAIVTDVPGTTRDVLRCQVHLDGLPVNLIDTAGLRAAVDVVEVEGVRRARNEIARADHVLYIVDATAADAGTAQVLGTAQVPGTAQTPGAAQTPGVASWAAQLQQLPAGVAVTVVFNKIDVNGAPARLDGSTTPARIFVSARSGAGLDLLRTHLKASAGYQESASGALAARRRHLDALHRARQHVERAADILSTSRAVELFAEDLRLAQRALGEITGEFTSEDLLGEIFGSFCVGK